MYIKKYEQIENIIDRGKAKISWQLIGAVEIKERDEGEREGVCDDDYEEQQNSKRTDDAAAPQIEHPELQQIHIINGSRQCLLAPSYKCIVVVVVAALLLVVAAPVAVVVSLAGVAPGFEMDGMEGLCVVIFSRGCFEMYLQDTWRRQMPVLIPPVAVTACLIQEK